MLFCFSRYLLLCAHHPSGTALRAAQVQAIAQPSIGSDQSQAANSSPMGQNSGSRLDQSSALGDECAPLHLGRLSSCREPGGQVQWAAWLGLRLIQHCKINCLQNDFTNGTIQTLSARTHTERRTCRRLSLAGSNCSRFRRQQKLPLHVGLSASGPEVEYSHKGLFPASPNGVSSGQSMDKWRLHLHPIADIKSRLRPLFGLRPTKTIARAASATF